MNAHRAHNVGRRVLIAGSSGMLGTELVSAAASRGFSVSAYSGPEDLDIVDHNAVFDRVRNAKPDVVLNAAAYTDVDGAEDEQDFAMRINRDGPANLAAACRESEALLVHFSTDYVFSGSQQTPYTPSATPDPITHYGRTKLAGEQAITESGCRHLILRTSWLFAPHGRNFVRTMLKLASERKSIRVVNDQRGRPTSCRDLAEMTMRLVEMALNNQRIPPILHAANEGECTWHEFTVEIVRLADLPCEVQPCSTDEMPRPAKRPAYSVLDLSEITKLLGPPTHWRDALAACMKVIRAEQPEHQMKE